MKANKNQSNTFWSTTTKAASGFALVILAGSLIPKLELKIPQSILPNRLLDWPEHVRSLEQEPQVGVIEEYIFYLSGIDRNMRYLFDNYDVSFSVQDKIELDKVRLLSHNPITGDPTNVGITWRTQVEYDEPTSLKINYDLQGEFAMFVNDEKITQVCSRKYKRDWFIYELPAGVSTIKINYVVQDEDEYYFRLDYKKTNLSTQEDRLL